MTSRASVPMRRRLLLPALLLAHAGLLLVAGRRLPMTPPPVGAALSVTEVAAAMPPSPPLEVALVPVVATVDAPDLGTATDAAPPSAAPSAGCDVSSAVQTRLQSSAEVTAALRLVPRQSRSVADAMMLWDGHWIDPGEIGGSAALEPIRAAVAAAIRDAPAGCRDAPVNGPRLLVVASATGNQILAFGSGQWTWSQLLRG